MPQDLTIEILKQIRDGVVVTNERVEQTNDRLDQTIHRLDQTIERLDHLEVRLDQGVERLDAVASRFVEAELRSATALASLAGEMQTLNAHLRAQSDLRSRVERNEEDIRELKSQLAQR